MAPNTSYEYAPITAPKTIRLMHVQPGKETDPVRICLETITLDSAPGFESISYCWGDVKDQREVDCNNGKLSITSNLFSALVHFRQLDQPRILWADAICINQLNATEKGQQVLLMPEIYSQAARVLVWLGVADDPVYGSIPPRATESIREAIHFLPEFDPENTVDLSNKLKTLAQDSERLREEGKPNILDYNWAPLAAVLARPWFRRKWVVQEVSLSKEAVLCAGGGLEMPWMELGAFAFSFQTLGLEDFINLYSVNANEVSEHVGPAQHTDYGARRSRSLDCASSIFMVQMYKHHGTITDAIQVTTEFNCTDERDHIYSLLSLPPNGTRIKPDYNAPLSEVFHQFTITTLEEEESLKLLSLAPDKYRMIFDEIKRPEGLPTWVPDFRDIRGDTLVGYTVRPQAFCAGGRSKPVLSVSQDQRILSCEGRVVDTVKISAPSLISMVIEEVPDETLRWSHDKDSAKARRERYARWLKGCYRVAFGRDYSPEHTSNPSEELNTFSRTMLSGIDRMRNRASPEYIARFPEFMEWIFETAADPDRVIPDKPQFYPAEMIMLCEVMEVMSVVYTFCITEGGRFARISPNAQVGDSLCVLRGGEVPFAIRETGHGTYVLIGESYIDGLMDGEALETGPSGTIRLE